MPHGMWEFLSQKQERERRLKEFGDGIASGLQGLEDFGGRALSGALDTGADLTGAVRQPLQAGVDLAGAVVRQPLQAVRDVSRFYNDTLLPYSSEAVATFGAPSVGGPLMVGARGSLPSSFEEARARNAERPFLERTALNTIGDPLNLPMAIAGPGTRLGLAIGAGAAGGIATADALLPGNDAATIAGGAIGGVLGAPMVALRGLRGLRPSSLVAKDAAAGVQQESAKAYAQAQATAARKAAQSATVIQQNPKADLLGLEEKLPFQTGKRLGDIAPKAQGKPLIGNEATPLHAALQSFQEVTQRTIPSQAANIRNDFKNAVRGVFDFDAEGRVLDLGGAVRPFFGDIAEAPNSFALTKMQKQALMTVKGLVNRVEQNNLYYGAADNGVLTFADPDGFYFPRIAMGKDGVLKPTPPNISGSLGLGGKKPFQKPRYYESMQKGATAGINYADPENAIELYARGGLKHAADEWLTRAVLPYTNTTGGILADKLQVPALFGRYFDDPKVAADIAGILLPNTKMSDLAKVVNGVLIPIRATADMSAVLTLGMPGLWSNPKGWARASAQSGKAILESIPPPQMFSKVFGQGYTKLFEKGWSYDEAADLAQQAARGLTPMTRAEKIRIGLVHAGEEVGQSSDLGPSMQSWTGAKLRPAAQFVDAVMTPFSRSFSRFRTVFANELFDQGRLELKAAGKNADDLTLLRAIADDANRLVGVSKGNATDVEKAVLFAPNYFRAQLETIGKALNLKDWSPDHVLMRQRLLLMAGGALGLTTFLNQARGKETDYNPVIQYRDGFRWNPNFLRVRDVPGVGDVSLLGGMDSLLRMGMVMASGASRGNVGDMLQAIRPKWSPLMQMGWDAALNQDFMGQPVYDSTDQMAKYAAQQALPFGGAAVVRGEPAGSILYSALGGKATPLSPSDKLDNAALPQFGRPYRDLEPWQQKQIERDNAPVYEEFIAKSRAQTQQAYAVRQALLQQQTESDARFERGEISYTQWKDDYSRRKDQRRAVQNFIYRDQVRDQKSPLSQWTRIVERNTRADGTVNWDQVDAETLALPADAQAYLQRNTNLDGTPQTRRYEMLKLQAQPALREYKSIPAFLGLSAPDGEDVTQLLKEAQSQRNAARAPYPLKQIAYTMAKARGWTGMKLAAAVEPTALRNPKRAQYWRSNPILELTYGELAPVELRSNP